MRYTELNPVRAALVTDAGSWPWSSAAVHCGETAGDGFLDMGPWRHHWSADTWRAYLAAGEEQTNLAAIRRCTYTGCPLGTAEFIRQLEQKTRRCLAVRKGGHPRKLNEDPRQAELTFSGYYPLSSEHVRSLGYVSSVPTKARPVRRTPPHR